MVTSNQVEINAGQLHALRRRKERYTKKFRDASRYLAQLNAAAHDASEEFATRLQRSFANARDNLAFTQQQIRDILAAPQATLLHKSPEIEAGGSVIITQANDELLSFLARNPNSLHSLHSRAFEEIVWRIFNDQGCDVELQPATHDGGKDLIVKMKTPLGISLGYIQCKRYSPFRPVGVEVVRELYGIQTADKVNQSMIVTTSTFTSEAIDFAGKTSFLISLRDFSDVVTWLKNY